MTLLRACLTASVVALALGGCSDDPIETPPPFVGSPPGSPRTCADLADAGALDGLSITVAGERASCIADGLRCLLPEALRAPELCGAARVVAWCRDQAWVLSCGAEDAGGDASDD